SSDPGETISPVTDAGNGTYTATITSSKTVGTATITATDGAITGNATLTQTVGPPATITVQVSPGAIVAGGTSSAKATATVTDGEGHPVPNDTIAFSSSDPGQFFGPVSTTSNGSYSAEIRSSTTVGPATITATDPENVSGHATLIQAAGPSSMSLVATPTTSVTNQQVTLVAVVRTSSGSPTGTITFNSGSAPIAGCSGEPITPSSATASCQTSFGASTSPERLTAAFTPGPKSTAPGASAATTVIVNPDVPSVSLAVPGSVKVGQSAVYSAILAAPASRPGPVQPSGSVGFLDNGRPIPSCQSQILIGGSAKCTLVYGALGNHTISVRYGGDANFAAFTSAGLTTSVVAVPVPLSSVVPVPVPVTRVVQVPAHVAGMITSTMQWLFSYTRRSTRVLALGIKGASRAASILVTCHGRGCPFAKRTTRVSKTKRCRHKGKSKCPPRTSVNLAPPFKRPLRAGATITVRIRRPGWIGKYYRFVMEAGRPPRIQINCLAPGRTRPGVGCSR
ncbi:MAG: Ig-like domain repeat protein, partial [Acidimicrobiaceae bacterium]|nr:Ig-like domain repeat protein [Acidimicrobiaceae bacterium]